MNESLLVASLARCILNNSKIEARQEETSLIDRAELLFRVSCLELLVLFLSGTSIDWVTLDGGWSTYFKQFQLLFL